MGGVWQVPRDQYSNTWLLMGKGGPLKCFRSFPFSNRPPFNNSWGPSLLPTITTWGVWWNWFGNAFIFTSWKKGPPGFGYTPFPIIIIETQNFSSTNKHSSIPRCLGLILPYRYRYRPRGRYRHRTNLFNSVKIQKRIRAKVSFPSSPFLQLFFPPQHLDLPYHKDNALQHQHQDDVFLEIQEEERELPGTGC